MKLFLIHPGASHSTADVYNGFANALERQGVHELLHYDLDKRIFWSGAFYRFMYDRKRRSNPKLTPATTQDIIFHASMESVVRAIHYQVDYVVVFSAMYYPKYFINILKRAGLRVAVLLTESPYSDDDQTEIAALGDIVWTHERASLPLLRKANPNTHYMPHAWEPSIHKQTARAEVFDMPAHDVVFVGTGFKERIDLLSDVDWTGIDLGIYGNFRLLGSRNKLRKFLKSEEIDNRATAALYRGAKIGLNMFRTSKGYGLNVPHIERAESLSPRSYELAACGLFHLSDHRAEVGEVFGHTVPTFQNAKDLENQIRYYLEKPEERARLAAMLPGRVEGHTFDVRARQLINDLETTAEPRHAVRKAV